MDGFDAMDKELEDFKRNFGKEERDLTPRERYSYKRSMRRIREKHGLTDGLRTNRAGFKEYLKNVENRMQKIVLGVTLVDRYLQHLYGLR